MSVSAELGLKCDAGAILFPLGNQFYFSYVHRDVCTYFVSGN